MDYSTKAILVLVLNIVLPGLGTVVTVEDDPKIKNRGILQLVIYVVGIVLSWVTCGITALASLGMWIWALIDGINLMKKFNELAKQPPSTPPPAPPSPPTSA